MKISKRSIRKIVRENCGDVAVAPLQAPVVAAGDGLAETLEAGPEELMVEMVVASEALETVVESIQNAAQLCHDCGPEVAAQAPVVEAMVAQAEALQEMLEVQADLVAESAGLDFTGDVGELPGDEAFAVGLQAGLEGLV